MGTPRRRYRAVAADEVTTTSIPPPRGVLPEASLFCSRTESQGMDAEAHDGGGLPS